MFIIKYRLHKLSILNYNDYALLGCVHGVGELWALCARV